MYDLFDKHGQSHDPMKCEISQAYTYAEYINEALANDAIVPESVRDSLRLDIINMTYFEGPLSRWVLRDILKAYNVPHGELPINENGELPIPISNRRDADTEKLFYNIVLGLAKYYKLIPKPIHKEQDNKLKRQDVKQSVSLDEQIQHAVDKFNAKTGLPEEPRKIAFEDLALHTYWVAVFKERKPLFMNMRYAWKPAEWDYMTSELRVEHLANQPTQAWELASLFTTDLRGRTLESTNTGMLKFQDASIVNMLIYGKSNISQAMVPTILSLIRFGHSPSIKTQLDNYVIDRSDHKYVSDPITWRDDNMHELVFPQTDTQRMDAARGLIHLMNETDPKDLNMVNYYHIVAWIHINKKQCAALADLQIADTLHRGTYYH